MKLKISHYIHYSANLSIVATPQDYDYHFEPIEYRIINYKRHYDEYCERCIVLYKNTSIYFERRTLIYVI